MIIIKSHFLGPVSEFLCDNIVLNSDKFVLSIEGSRDYGSHVIKLVLDVIRVPGGGALQYFFLPQIFLFQSEH